MGGAAWFLTHLSLTQLAQEEAEAVGIMWSAAYLC